MTDSSQTDTPPVHTVVASPRRRIFREQSRRELVASFLWRLVSFVFFRMSPGRAFAWRSWLLRRFGAKIGRDVQIHRTARINFPWHLEVGNHSQLMQEVIVDSQARVTIGNGTRISQFSHLCTATHDYCVRTMPIIGRPIDIGDKCWLAADVFVGCGVRIGDGTVLGARSSVFRDVPAGVIVAGTPAREIPPKHGKH